MSFRKEFLKTTREALAAGLDPIDLIADVVAVETELRADERTSRARKPAAVPMSKVTPQDKQAIDEILNPALR
jgi:hypothetical protein